MRSIDKSTQVIRRAIKSARREKINAVIAPTEFTWEICDRHHFDHADARARKLAQLASSGGPRSLGRKRADVHFVNDLALQLQTRPLLIAPRKLSMIDHRGGPMRPSGLISRCGIGIKIFAPIQPKTVARADADLGGPREVAIRFGLQRLKGSV